MPVIRAVASGPFPERPPGRRVLTLLFVLLVGSSSPELPAAATLQSPFDTLTFMQIEKQLRDPARDAETVADLPEEQVFLPLPKEVADRLGPYSVDYASFTTTYLPPGEAEQLVKVATQWGLIAQTYLDRRVELPWHTFEPGSADSRTPPESSILVRPVPDKYLIQFAYPIKQEWLAGLTECGVQQLAYLQQRTLLVRTGSEKSVLDCTAVAPYLSWIGPFLNVDRVSPELLELESGEGWELHFVLGTDLGSKLRDLPPGLTADQLSVSRNPELPDSAVLHARGPVAKLQAFVASDPDLLSVTNRGVGELSDERQGQIVAGNHNGTAPVLSPRYKDWLNSRGLLGATNQQTVCVVDRGYDTGYADTLPGSQRHPDLVSPSERIVAFRPIGSTTTWDRQGHGTMVAGIIAAEGGVAPPAPYQYSLTDPAGFFMGSGIAPRSKLAFVRVNEGTNIDNLAVQDAALNFCRNSGSVDLALIANESWNERHLPDATSPYYRPQNQYTAAAQFFDHRVLDANTVLAGTQPMVIVFSAGNDAYDLGTNSIRRDSVSSPAVAKNVISVGATTSYRPYEEPPSGCRSLPNGERPPDQNALHIARVANFSGRGKLFTAEGVDKLHQVRVKPDLVAPAVRVFSTVPFLSTAYAPTGDATGCVKGYPAPLNGSTLYTPYTYGNGTSFAAPVVSGVAALARKWFLDRGTTPSPSLVKAALIATADDLGPSGLTGNDPRPSNNYGWGRVNLNRLTDPSARFYTTDNQGLAVGTGQQRTWQRTVDNPNSPSFIVLVWSDPPSAIPGNSQVALVNNLALGVDEVLSTRFWRGNNFQENVSGVDTGYSYRFSAGQSPFTDGINNVEAIFIPPNTFAAGQQIIIKVTGESVPASTQKFAIYAYNVRPSS
jgi:Subtilase family